MVSHMHDCVHGDLKSKNALMGLSGEREPHVKVVDFGYSVPGVTVIALNYFRTDTYQALDPTKRFSGSNWSGGRQHGARIWQNFMHSNKNNMLHLSSTAFAMWNSVPLRINTRAYILKKWMERTRKMRLLSWLTWSFQCDGATRSTTALLCKELCRTELPANSEIFSACILLTWFTLDLKFILSEIGFAQICAHYPRVLT